MRVTNLDVLEGGGGRGPDILGIANHTVPQAGYRCTCAAEG